MAVALLCAASSASASGLTRVEIPGPGGAVPFKSPGGQGPTFVSAVPGDTHRFFVGTKDGYIYVVRDGVTQTTPFLDIHTQVSTTNEDGMFSLVFDPNFVTNRRFYVDYSDNVNTTLPNLDNYHLDAFQVSASNPDVAVASSQTQILMVPTTGCTNMASPHYGGQLAFGPDGHLWLTIGDGGDGSPNGEAPPDCQITSPQLAEELSTLHGKMLRIDPQPSAAPDANGNRYTVPSSNPLVGVTGALPEIWASGLRNPWRFSFDSATGDIIVGDVGNDQQEEVDRIPSTLAPGAKPPFYGWPCTEGVLPWFNPANCQSQAPLTGTPTPVAPLFVSTHVSGCTALIGGVVMHDPSLGGDYNGRYVYGFFCGHTPENPSGHILTTNLNDPSPTPRDEGISAGLGLSSFGTDACGHPYATNVLSGGVWRIEGPTPGPCGEFTAPQTSLTPPVPSGVVTSSTQSVSFTSSIAGSTFTCSLDGGPAQSCTSPKQYTGLLEGPHTIAVTASDEAGNTDPTPATASFTVDTAVPDTTITSAPPGSVPSTSAAISFVASEPDVSFTCKLDTAAAASCTSPKSYSSLAQGPHTVTVTATDAAGNPDPTPASATWTVDTVAPDTTINSGPSGTVASGSTSFDFSSNEAGATFTCKLDSAAAVACTSPKSYSGLADGSHTFTVTATDAAGNSDATPATRTWTVDSGAPDTSITQAPSGTMSSSTASISFTSSEAGSTFTCKLDGGTAVACTSPKTYNGLGDGSHTVVVTATDTAGNPDPTPASATWTVDTTAPDTSISGGPSGPTNSATATFTFSSSEAGSTFTCQLDTGTGVACTSPKTYNGLSEGAHTFKVTATDAAGNPDPTAATRSFTVDTAAPQTTITAGPSGTTNETDAAFTFTSSEAGSSFTCQLDGGTASPCASPQSYTGLADGSHTFRVTAADAAGNPDPTPATETWAIDSGAPQTTIDSAPSGLVSSSSATITFSSEAGATFTCQLDSGSVVACTSPKTYNGLSEGAHTVKVIATDTAGNPDPTPATRSWTVDTTAPNTSIDSGPSTLVNSASATFTFSSPDAGATFTCQLDNGTAVACTSPRTYTGLGDGPHTITVIASDTVGNADQTPATRSWTVDTTAPDTTILTGPSAPTSSASATFTFSSSEAGSTFQCKLDGAAATPCLSPQPYTALSEGSHTLTVTASDAAGNPDPTPAARTWTVDTTAPQTTIDSAPSGTVATSSASVSFSASEAGSTFACSLDGGVAQACTSPTSFTGLGHGLHTVSVVATDTVGNTDPSPATASWTVAPSGPPPTTTTTTTAPPPTTTTTTTTTASPPPPPTTTTIATPTTTTTPTTSTTPVTGQSKPPLHLSLKGLRSVPVDKHGMLRLNLTGISQNAKGTLTLRSGTQSLAPAFRFTMKTGKGVTLVLTLSQSSRRTLARKGRLKGTLTLTLVAADGQKASASATITVLSAPAKRKR